MLPLNIIYNLKAANEHDLKGFKILSGILSG